MISAVCGRAPPENELLAPHPLLLPPAAELPRVSQDWLSVTKPRPLPSLVSCTTTGAATGTESSMAATTFEDTPHFFKSSRSLSDNRNSQAPCLIRAMMISSSRPRLVISTTRALVIFVDTPDCVVAGVETVTAVGCAC